VDNRKGVTTMPAHRIGRSIAAARDLLGWSQGELAAAVTKRGVPLADYTLGKIERGERRARADELGAIADVLGVPYEWFHHGGPDWLDQANPSPSAGGEKGAWLTPPVIPAA
jgi:transcriptional regulator with XRE-family HTH domain